MIEYFYDKTVFILVPTETTDDYGSVVKSYTTTYNLKCKIQRSSGDKSIQQSKECYRYSDKLYCNYTTSLSTNYRIKDSSSNYWQILSIYSPLNRHIQADLKECNANST